MKQRNGFVSNSSSSSFVVILPRRPESAADVESIFFPDGYKPDSWRDDDDEPVTANMLAATIWDDILSQRKVPDVRGRILRLCNEYAIRDFEDALWTMGATEKEHAHILGLQETDEEKAAAEFVDLILDKARNQGAQLCLLPEHDTNEVYMLSYGSGCGAVEDVMFGNSEFLEHLAYVMVMDS